MLNSGKFPVTKHQIFELHVRKFAGDLMTGVILPGCFINMVI